MRRRLLNFLSWCVPVVLSFLLLWPNRHDWSRPDSPLRIFRVAPMAGAFIVLGFLLVYVPLMYLMYRVLTRERRRRVRLGLCLKCGYNLTGNVSGNCPECGSAVPQAQGIR